MPRVAVLGAGIMGASTALLLAEAECEACRARLAREGGASATAAGDGDALLSAGWSLREPWGGVERRAGGGARAAACPRAAGGWT